MLDHITDKTAILYSVYKLNQYLQGLEENRGKLPVVEYNKTWFTVTQVKNKLRNRLTSIPG